MFVLSVKRVPGSGNLWLSSKLILETCNRMNFENILKQWPDFKAHFFKTGGLTLLPIASRSDISIIYDQ